MKCFCLTWNTHGQSVIPYFTADADLILISLQECYKMPKIRDLFPQYKFVVTVSFFRLQTIIFSKTPFEYKVLRIGQGPFWFPNKGAIAVIIDGKTLHYNMHLDAHVHRNDARMKQIKAIFEHSLAKEIETIVLTGDLNFRIERGVDQAKVFLANYPSFLEHEIKFTYTYKYKGSLLDGSREPSYCDRIFVASNRSVAMQEYFSMHDVTISDHKPICGIFKIGKKVSNRRLVSYCPRNQRSAILITKLYVFILYNYLAVVLAIMVISMVLLCRVIIPEICCWPRHSI